MVHKENQLDSDGDYNGKEQYMPKVFNNYKIKNVYSDYENLTENYLNIENSDGKLNASTNYSYVLKAEFY